MDLSTEEKIQQFSLKALGDLKKGKTVKEIVGEFESTITPVPEYESETITQSYIAEEAGNTDDVRALLEEFFRRVPGQVEVINSEVTDERVLSPTPDYIKASAMADQSVSDLKTKVGEEYGAFARKLGENFPEQVKIALEKQAQDRAVIEAQKQRLEEVRLRATSVKTAEQLQKYRQSFLDAATISADQKEEAMRLAEEQLYESRSAAERQERIYKQSQEALLEAKRVALTKDTITRPDTFFAKTLELAATTDQPVETIVQAAEAHEWSVASGATASNVPLGGHGFFQTIGGATSSAIKADNIFDKLAPGKQVPVIKDVIERSFEKIEQPIAAVTEKIGRRVTTHQLVRDAIRRGDTAVGASTASENVSGLISTVFKSATISPQTIEAMGQSGDLSWLSTHAMYAFLVRDKIKNKVGKTILTEGAKKLGFKGALKGLTTALALTGPQGLLAKVALDVVVGKVFDVTAKFVGGVGQFVSSAGGILNIFEGKELPASSFIVALPFFIVVVFVAMLIFPSFLNVATFPDNIRLAALATKAGGGALPGDNVQPFNIAISAAPIPPSGGVPTAISYTITLSPLKPGDALSVNQAEVCFSVYGGSGTIPCQSISPSQLSSGSYTFTVAAGQQFDNSVVTATVVVNANTGTETGVDGSASTSTIIGNPPTGCFVFGEAGAKGYFYDRTFTSSAWDDRSKTMGAIGILAASPTYLSKYVCPGGPITLYRVKEDFGGGLTNGANSIFLFDVCVKSSNQGCMTYTLAHETGHIINNRPNAFNVYKESPTDPGRPMHMYDEYILRGLFSREGMLWTYPNMVSGETALSEDFAETLGVYAIWRSYSFIERQGRAGLLNYPEEYPLHYEFAKSKFGIEY